MALVSFRATVLLAALVLAGSVAFSIDALAGRLYIAIVLLGVVYITAPDRSTS